SKACKSREDHKFYRIYNQLLHQLKKKNRVESLRLLPIDSIVITLTSKLFWQQNYRQVKLLNGININPGNLTEFFISFGQAHDAKFTDYIPTMIGSNEVGVMDRGFASWPFIEAMSETQK
ncbi:MAG: IS4 family transposase, partial [Roseofilum sp. SID2]|nr:IS4 family transposase [Roseofilum sp. SID2]